MAGDHAAAAYPEPEATREGLALSWLVRLRWGLVAGQMLTVVAGAHAIGTDAVPWFGVVVPIVVAMASNLVLARGLARGRARPPWLSGAVLCMDTALLTILLQLTGGPANPFSILYLVHVTLAAVVLGPRWTWLLTALSLAGYATLFLLPRDPESLHAMHDPAALARHLQAMLVAFAVAAGLTARYVGQLAAAIDRRDAELALTRVEAARNERLASLTTLAAGAAHELGTPLGTIAIAAAELERALDAGPDAALADDARLIRAEVRRCRTILDRLATDAGEASGEAPVAIDLHALGTLVLDGVAADAQARVRLEVPAPARLRLPVRALASAIGSLVRNGLDADPAGRVVVALRADDTGLVARVTDTGPGMPPEVLARAVEPFFTTKPAGQGMGLGLFLVRTLCEQLGGRLRLASTPGQGTEVVLEVPAPRAIAAGARAA